MRIVLDVKVGDGAFMKTLGEARVLAEQMLELGHRAGKEVVCLLTDMDQPLGRAVGNALEIREAIDMVRGNGPDDFSELVLDACARLLAFSDLGIDLDEGRRRAEAAVADGSAHAVYERWVRAQGGDPDPEALPEAPVRISVPSPRDGIVTRVGALAVGVAALELGAGRRTKADTVDHAVGVLCSLASAATRCWQATTSPRCMRATTLRRKPPSPRSSRRTRSATPHRPSRAFCSRSSGRRTPAG